MGVLWHRVRGHYIVRNLCRTCAVCADCAVQVRACHNDE